jgi:hypothetical protein
MSDPVFGLVYDTGKVHFERAPPSVERMCAADLQGRKNFWLYAYWKALDTEYFLLSSRESQESGGAAVIHGNKCTLGLPDWILSGEPSLNPDNRDRSIVFPASVLHGLASDLLKRYSVAFGSKRNFLDATHRLRHFSPTDLPPVLRTEYEAFSKE